MKFVQRDLGEAAEASSGGGLRGMLAEFWHLILLSAVLLIAIGVVFAMAAEIAVRFITPEQESRWLRSIVPTLPAVEPDAEPLRSKTALARAVLAKLAARPEVPRMEYRLIVLEDTAINAVALPGGTVGVTTGLLQALDQEIGLAFVLGHELGHFKNRDHLRAFIRDAGRGTAISLIFGASGALTAHADQWLALSYSRDQEFAADRFGLELVQAVYGHTAGSEAVLHLLHTPDSSPAWSHTLSTHPDTAERLQQLQSHAQSLAPAAPAP